MRHVFETDQERPHVVVYEQDGAWTRALRRYAESSIAIVEAGPVAAASSSIRRWPRVNLVVVSAWDEALDVMTWAELVRRARPGSLRMAVVRPADHELGWCLRESGMAMIWEQFWQAPAMARLIGRFWRRMPSPDLSIEQRIWNNLPWSSSDAVERWEGGGDRLDRPLGH